MQTLIQKYNERGISALDAIDREMVTAAARQAYMCLDNDVTLNASNACYSARIIDGSPAWVGDVIFHAYGTLDIRPSRTFTVKALIGRIADSRGDLESVHDRLREITIATHDLHFSKCCALYMSDCAVRACRIECEIANGANDFRETVISVATYESALIFTRLIRALIVM